MTKLVSPSLCLDIVRDINQSFEDGWFDPFDFMATIEIESHFDAEAYRFEERLNDASYGLCQILSKTARDVGYNGLPEGLYDPRTNIRYGMFYQRRLWTYLSDKLSRDPSKREWVEAYNEGPGNVLRHRDDEPYYVKWLRARANWPAKIPGGSGNPNTTGT